MEPTGLALGLVGLAGVFSACLDVVERVDSYRDFGVDSRAILSQFDADKLLFRKWGKAVGLEENGKIANDHHKNLDDPTIVSIVRDILHSINDIAGEPGEGSSPGQHLPFKKFRGNASGKSKIGWALRQKARFITLLQQFGNLVDKLHALVPPQSTNDTIHPIRRTHTGPDLPVDEASGLGDRRASRFSDHDSQLILLELDKQIKRKG